MSTLVTVLLEGTLATASGVAYTSTNCVSTIDTITAGNESAAVAVATVQLISPDGTLIASFSKSIQPGTSWPFSLDVRGQVIASGGKINVLCPTANAIRVRISGRQFT
jgi:hypothetical protein